MKFKYVLSVASLSLLTSVAQAGLVQTAPVTIDFVNRIATGDMLTARESKNKFEFIGCGVRHGVGGLIFAFCQAGLAESDDQKITCFTDNPLLVDAINSIGDFSFITFAWDVDANCTRIGNSTQSFYLPELKTKSK